MCGKDISFTPKNQRFCGNQRKKNGCAYKRQQSICKKKSLEYYYDSMTDEKRKEILKRQNKIAVDRYQLRKKLDKQEKTIEILKLKLQIAELEKDIIN